MYCRAGKPASVTEEMHSEPQKRPEAGSRFLGLDFGDKTIGVSVSGPGGKTATGITTLKRPDENAFRPSLKALKEIIREYGVTDIVLGYPKHLDGSDSPRCKKTLEFKDKLNRYFKSIPVQLWDERLSTRAVTRVFDGKRSRLKNHVDEMAAVYILQGYLDYRQGEIKMDNEQVMLPEDDNTIVLHDDEGNEITMEVLSSRTDNGATYLLAVEDGEGAEVMIFRLIEDGDEDTIFELVEEDDDDFDHAFELFKEDFKTLGIEIDEIEL